MKMNKKKPWFMFFWMTVFTAILMFSIFINHKQKEVDLGYCQFKQYIKSGRVLKVLVGPGLIKGRFKDKDGVLREFKTAPMMDPNLVKDMEDNKVLDFSAEKNGSLASFILSILPVILIGLVCVCIMRNLAGGNKRTMSFGKTKAKLAGNDEAKKVTFNDVAGCDEAKEELKEIVEFLKNPAKFQKLGGKIPKGVLLVGAPGTGKTLLAKAVAGEAGIAFFSSSGSEFMEMFVGVGASRVRDLFERGRRSAPCLLFIDEIDAVGRHRSAFVSGGGHDEREQTLNQLLVEMDGFDTKEGVILIAATNRPDVLDSALLRPGRFDRQISISHPALKDREEILGVHARKVKLDANVSLNVIAKRTPGFVGADLANLVNEAALLAARNNQETVNMKNIEESIERVIAGPQRKSLLMSEKEKKATAYHEAGHALVAKLLPFADPVHKITIVPRGSALGYVLQLPQERYLTSKTELLAQLALALGGRAAEELVFSELTTGAENDISKSTKIAIRMVTKLGMSDKIGPVFLQKPDEEVFLGRDVSESLRYSEKTSEIIDEEVRSLMDNAMKTATTLLKDNMNILTKLADYLLERENLDGEDIDRIIKGEDLAPLPEKSSIATDESKEEVIKDKEVTKATDESKKEVIKDKEVTKK